MENNRSKFESHGYIINSIAEKLEIQISQEMRLVTNPQYGGLQEASRGTGVIHGRWQEIRYSKRNNSPYITMFGKRLYVAVAYNGGFNPTVVEKFDNKTDADSYAALMCRTKQRRYIVLEQVTEWDGTPQENA